MLKLKVENKKLFVIPESFPTNSITETPNFSYLFSEEGTYY